MVAAVAVANRRDGSRNHMRQWASVNDAGRRAQPVAGGFGAQPPAGTAGCRASAANPKVVAGQGQPVLCAASAEAVS
eukprot:7391652-Prymnesium_polylepis.1